MPLVDLDAQEWTQLMAMISQAPWRDANPLLMKIGAQLQAQHAQFLRDTAPVEATPLTGNGKENRHEH